MKTIMVCIKRRFDPQPSCAARGSEELANRLEEQIASRGLPLRIHRFPCLGMCEEGPNMKVVGGDIFHAVGETDLERIIQAALED